MAGIDHALEGIPRCASFCVAKAFSLDMRDDATFRHHDAFVFVKLTF